MFRIFKRLMHAEKKPLRCQLHILLGLLNKEDMETKLAED
jgi:hypothetical protein